MQTTHVILEAEAQRVVLQNGDGQAGGQFKREDLTEMIGDDGEVAAISSSPHRPDHHARRG